MILLKFKSLVGSSESAELNGIFLIIILFCSQTDSKC